MNRHAVRVSVCIPSVRSDTLAAAIESITAQTRDDWEIIVVTQGEDQGLRSLMRRMEAEHERVRTVRIVERGVSRARNAGVREAAGETIAFIDDDCVAEPDWLERSIQALDADPSVGVVAGSLIAPPKVGWRPARCPESIPVDQTLRPEEHGDELPPGARFVSANLVFRRSAWVVFGPFDEELGAGTSFRGGEDLDLLVRIVDRGVAIRFLPDAVVHHTSGTRYGLRSVIDLSTAYRSGQGAVAAKVSMAKGEEDPWRAAMWDWCLWGPLRNLRWHRVPTGAIELAAFDRAYRRCMREFTLDAGGMLAPKGTS